MRVFGKYALMFGLTAACCLAQTSSFGQAARGVATEMTGIATWIGIILCVICGIGLMAGGGHGSNMIGKIGGFVLGLIFALAASPIVGWIQMHTL